jgi:N-formylglutamate amidohydrolase
MDPSPLMTVHGDDPDAGGAVIATAIHAGHDLRPEVADEMLLPEDVRTREEDPCTDRIAAVVPVHVVVHRSRFETDVNRARDGSVYLRPDDAWGLDVWRRPLPDDVVARSRTGHDEFYATMRALLDRFAARGPFVVLDVHSYNHRRGGPDAPAAALETNPDVNVGTGTLDRARFGTVVDRFVAELREPWVVGHRLDVRENVRFRGGWFSRWVHEQYPGRGCALAVEWKKTFMDEWTGLVDDDHVAQLADALRDTLPTLTRALTERS